MRLFCWVVGRFVCSWLFCTVVAFTITVAIDVVVVAVKLVLVLSILSLGLLRSCGCQDQGLLNVVIVDLSYCL